MNEGFKSKPPLQLPTKSPDQARAPPPLHPPSVRQLEVAFLPPLLVQLRRQSRVAPLLRVASAELGGRSKGGRLGVACLKPAPQKWVPTVSRKCFSFQTQQKGVLQKKEETELYVFRATSVFLFGVPLNFDSKL